MTDRPRVRYVTATTLDGFLADERDSLDWLLEQDHDPDGAGGHEHMTGAGALVMGATTYRWVVDHLAETGEPWPYEQPTFVFTPPSPSVRDGRCSRGGSTCVCATSDGTVRSSSRTTTSSARGPAEPLGQRRFCQAARAATAESG